MKCAHGGRESLFSRTSRRYIVCEICRYVQIRDGETSADFVFAVGVVLVAADVFRIAVTTA
jgi:hypothetical protein